MIKANELRIGNYVQDTVSGEWMIVDELGENVGAVVINRDKYPLPAGWKMGRIPLTDEIVNRLVYGEFSFYRVSYNDKVPGRHAYWLIDIRPGICFSKRVTYVDQLQNVYFFLTGEELEIKL